ncbi:MAG: 4-alpha-glucanotransferase [Clostridiales bacterium]|nr:4-alpha-glucanotransferase [Clostridiales bacterium]
MKTKVNARINKEQTRRAGVLMPVSSLPSPFGIGTLGQGAYDFVDWLHSAGMKIWQVLPLLPTGYGDSPYQSCASDALNYYFIDFDALEKDGLLEKSDYEDIVWSDDVRRVDYGRQFWHKVPLLKKAFANFNKEDEGWQNFLKEGFYADFALFMSLKNRFDHRAWSDWDEPYKNADKATLEGYKKENREEIEFWQFTQFLFLRQWKALLSYAHEKGIEVMGDMPIYVSYDSVETWLHRDELFMLDKKGNTSLRAGVPPDAFSEDGQLWGNPVYDWKKLKKSGYQWWKNRIHYALSLFDIVRIDHFRAFDRFYAIPAHAETAKEGKWMHGPKAALFQDMKDCAIIAEDLGVIDDGVRKLLAATGYAGMKVFEFAFDGNPENEYLPIYYNENSVAYTGTHDNQTLRGFIEEMDGKTRKAFEKELENQCLQLDVPYLTETIDDECESIIRLLISSAANTVIVPMHDVLCMGEEARLNAPSTVSGQNWTFRFTDNDLKKRKAAFLKSLCEEYKR